MYRVKLQRTTVLLRYAVAFADALGAIVFNYEQISIQTKHVANYWIIVVFFLYFVRAESLCASIFKIEELHTRVNHESDKYHLTLVFAETQGFIGYTFWGF